MRQSVARAAPSVAAAAVTVLTLGSLAPGARGIVSGFVRDDDFTQRLMQLGLLEGVVVEVVRRAPGGDPIELNVMGYALSLRRQEADLILLELPPQ